MNLVPFCFDKLRKFAKERKVYRFYINKMNHIVQKKANLREGFVKWMCFTWHRHNQLSACTYVTLDRIDKVNTIGK